MSATRTSPRRDFLVCTLTVLMIQLATAVNTFPQIRTEAYNQTLNLSSTAVFTCHVRDLGDHHVTWFKLDPSTSLSSPLAVGKQLFTTDPRYSISFYSISLSDSIWSLEIYQLDQSDEGTYICKIANRKASVSISIHLHVQIPMTIFPANVYVEPGAHVQVNCSIAVNDHDEGKKSPLTWHFSSNQINKSRLHDVHIRKQAVNRTFSSFLIINPARTSHTGIWTCVYRRQRLSAKVIVAKDILKHQRASALLANSSQRTMTSNDLLSFVVTLMFLLVFKN